MAVPSGEGILAINQRVTQQDFANRIGCSREMVSRVFNDLVKGGYLSVEQHKIVIRKRLPSSW
jgi:CRP/FNR family cyclic AMP-dependent transcriptional regulator